jgi:hypothetical protein
LVHWLIQLVTFGKAHECDRCKARRSRLNRIRLWPLRERR